MLDDVIIQLAYLLNQVASACSQLFTCICFSFISALTHAVMLLKVTLENLAIFFVLSPLWPPPYCGMYHHCDKNKLHIYSHTHQFVVVFKEAKEPPKHQMTVKQKSEVPGWKPKLNLSPPDSLVQFQQECA